jgi:hypothetical protein
VRDGRKKDVFGAGGMEETMRVLIRPNLRLKTRVSALQPDHVNEPDFAERCAGRRGQRAKDNANRR